MCWNWYVSLISGAIGISVSIFALKRNNFNDRYLGTWLFSVTLIQLLEFFIWVDHDCHTFNSVISKLTLSIVWLQPLSACLFSPFADGFTKTKKKVLFTIGLFVYFPIFLNFLYAGTIGNVEGNGDWCTKVGPSNKHLSWFFVSDKRPHTYELKDVVENFFFTILEFDEKLTFSVLSFIFAIGIVSPLLLLKPKRIGILFGGLGAISFLFSFFHYGIQEFTSMWCWYAVGISIIYIPFSSWKSTGKTDKELEKVEVIYSKNVEVVISKEEKNINSCS